MKECTTINSGTIRNGIKPSIERAKLLAESLIFVEGGKSTSLTDELLFGFVKGSKFVHMGMKAMVDEITSTIKVLHMTSFVITCVAYGLLIVSVCLQDHRFVNIVPYGQTNRQ